MNKNILLMAAIVIACCLAVFSLAGYIVTLDQHGLNVSNPQAAARADQIAQQTSDQAAGRALQRDTAQRIQPVVIVAGALAYLGIGIGALILAIAGAFALAAWLNKRATTIYPNSAGQYPLVVRRCWGGQIVHDANRALGPAAIYSTPTVLDVVAAAAAYLRTGGEPLRADVSGLFPQPGSEPAMVHVASQAASVQLMAAATRPAGLMSQQPGAPVARDVARRMLTDHQADTPADMPTITWPSRVPLTGLLANTQPDLDRLVLGVTVTDSNQSEVVTASLSNLVHVAVGGSSGSGKSLFLRALAYQMALARQAPELVLVDLEAVTFAPFDSLDRLRYPIADTEADALAVFADLVGELEHRRELYAQHPGVDSLAAYNRIASQSLRVICILVDESTALLGDKDVERACRTLALRARKYGLWMVLGGQDWKASSLDTSIRNQLGARIQFKAMSASQSRVLLEQSGAEDLDAPGRALAILPGRGLFKMQAPFVNGEIYDLVGSGPMYAMPATVDQAKDDTAQRVRAMHAGGASMRQIEQEIYGYTGGKAHTEVARVLGK